MFDTPHPTNAQELHALRELLAELVEKLAPVKPVIHRTDIATMPCKKLVQRIIDERGPQAAATLATKLNAALAAQGKTRVKLVRPARNGNGVYDDDAD